MKTNYTTKLTIAAAVLFCLGIQNAAVAQTTKIINVSEDTYVDGTSSTVDSNFGSDVEARAKDPLSINPRIAYYKYDISAGMPSSVTTAKLTFHTYLPSSKGITDIVQLFKSTSDWDETVVTYTLKSDTGELINEVGIQSVPVSTPNDYSKLYTIDVTAYFNEALAAKATSISFALSGKPKSDGGGANNIRLGTRESADGASSIEIKYTSLGVNDIANNEASLKVFPNPVNSTFTVNKTFTDSDLLEVSIINALGQKVATFNENAQAAEWSKEFNVKDLKMNSGVYFVKVSSQSNGSSVSKIVVE